MDGAIVIYDSDCGFCKWCLAALLRAGRPRAFRPLALGTPEADRLLADLTARERDASWHLVLESGAAGGSSGAEVAEPDLVAERGRAPVAFGAEAGPGQSPARFSAGAALAPAMDLIRFGRVPAALFRRFPGASERGYRWVADHRGLLGRLVGGRARHWAGRVIAAHEGPTQ